MVLGRVCELIISGKEGDWLLVSFSSSVISSHKPSNSEDVAKSLYKNNNSNKLKQSSLQSNECVFR